MSADPAVNVPLEVHRALGAQLDADLIDRVEKHAAQRCMMLGRVGLAAEPDDLTQEAIEATLSGERTWDPARCDLYGHLCGVITSRTHRTMKQAARFPHVRMGNARGDETDPVETAASLHRPTADPESAVLDADLACRTFLTLRSMAEDNNDHQVIGIIDAWAEGFTKRAVVAKRLGISTRRFPRVADGPGERHWGFSVAGSMPSALV